MKYYVNINLKARHGWELQCEDGRILPLNIKTTDNYLKMPDEVVAATNRKYVSLAALDKTDGNYEVEPKAVASNSGGRMTKSSVESLEEYLEGEDLELFRLLVTKASNARAVAQAKAEAERAKAEYERLMAEYGLKK